MWKDRVRYNIGEKLSHFDLVNLRRKQNVLKEETFDPSDNTIKAEGLGFFGDFAINPGKSH